MRLEAEMYHSLSCRPKTSASPMCQLEVFGISHEYGPGTCIRPCPGFAMMLINLTEISFGVRLDVTMKKRYLQ